MFAVGTPHLELVFKPKTCPIWLLHQNACQHLLCGNPVTEIGNLERSQTYPASYYQDLSLTLQVLLSFSKAQVALLWGNTFFDSFTHCFFLVVPLAVTVKLWIFTKTSDFPLVTAKQCYNFIL